MTKLETDTFGGEIRDLIADINNPGSLIILTDQEILRRTPDGSLQHLRSLDMDG